MGGQHSLRFWDFRETETTHCTSLVRSTPPMQRRPLRGARPLLEKGRLFGSSETASRAQTCPAVWPGEEATRDAAHTRGSLPALSAPMALPSPHSPLHATLAPPLTQDSLGVCTLVQEHVRQATFHSRWQKFNSGLYRLTRLRNSGQKQIVAESGDSNTTTFRAQVLSTHRPSLLPSAGRPSWPRRGTFSVGQGAWQAPGHSLIII